MNFLNKIQIIKKVIKKEQKIKGDEFIYTLGGFSLIDTDEGIAFLKINNFRIMTDSYHKNSSGYHLVPPSIKSGSVYKEIVFFEKNKTFWYQLEGKVLKEYEDSILAPEMIGPKTITPEIIDEIIDHKIID